MCNKMDISKGLNESLRKWQKKVLVDPSSHLLKHRRPGAQVLPDKKKIEAYRKLNDNIVQLRLAQATKG